MPVFDPECPQSLASEVWQRHKAIFMAFATPDMNPAACRIHIPHLQGQGFAQSQSHGIGCQDKDPVA
jgi:hypothetical protein